MTAKKGPTMSIHTLVVGTMAVNCYVIVDTKTHEALIVDPGDDSIYITDKVQKLNVRPVAVVATHGHFDHIMAAFAIQRIFRIPFMIHSKDTFLLPRMAESAIHFLGIRTVDPPPTVTRFVHEGEKIALGSLLIEVIETPGHTPGSVCLYHKASSSLFCGDLVFFGGGVGRTDFSYSERKALEKSIDRIIRYPSATTLYCGHGPPSTVSKEAPHHTR